MGWKSIQWKSKFFSPFVVPLKICQLDSPDCMPLLGNCFVWGSYIDWVLGLLWSDLQMSIICIHLIGWKFLGWNWMGCILIFSFSGFNCVCCSAFEKSLRARLVKVSNQSWWILICPLRLLFFSSFNCSSISAGLLTNFLISTRQILTLIIVA